MTNEITNPHEMWLRKLAAELQSEKPPTKSCIVHTVLQAANEVGELQRNLSRVLGMQPNPLNSAHEPRGDEVISTTYEETSVHPPSSCLHCDRLAGEHLCPVAIKPSPEQRNEECPDGEHDWGEYFCRRCGRSFVLLGSVESGAPRGEAGDRAGLLVSPQCIYRSGCKNPDVCGEAGCCVPGGAEKSSAPQVVIDTWEGKP